MYIFPSPSSDPPSPTSQALSDLSVPTNRPLSSFESEFSDGSNALLSSYLAGSPCSESSDNTWEWIPAPRRDVDVELPCRVPLVPMYDEVLYDQWNSSMCRRDREISETRGRYMHRVSSTSTRIILPPRASKWPGNKNPVVIYPLEYRFPFITFLTYLFSIEESVLNLLAAPSSQLGLFPGGDLSKETEIKPPEREDAYLNERDPHGVHKFFVQHGHQPHRSIRDGFHTTSGLLGDTPPPLFTASTCFLLVNDVIASGGKVLREVFHPSCYD